MSKGRVLVGLSGGVDSSVSALLLKQLGYEVEALFMKNWDDEDGSPYCSVKEDFMDAVFISDQLEIPLEQVSFSKEYRDNVFSYFLKELEAGRTLYSATGYDDENFVEVTYNLTQLINKKAKTTKWVSDVAYKLERMEERRYEKVRRNKTNDKQVKFTAKAKGV